MISRVNTNVKNKQTSTIKIHHFSFSYRIVIKDRLCFWLDRTHLFRNAFPLDIRNEDAATDVGVSTFDDHDTKSSRSLSKNT